MARFEVNEHEESDPLEIPPDDAAEFKRMGLVRVTHVPGGWCKLKPRQYVGVLHAGETELWIRPKVSVGRLLYLASYGDYPSGHYKWRDEEIQLGEADGLVTAMAVLFVKRLGLTFAKGLLHGYKERDETLTVMRGRLRKADQARRRAGLPIPLEVRYDDLDVDTIENRYLLAAVHALLALPGVPSPVHKELRRLAAAMAGVGDIPKGHASPPLPPVTRANVRYQPALRLASLILRAASAEQVGRTAPKDIPATAFVFDMNKVFENYLFGTLREHLYARAGGALLGQENVTLFDNGTLKRHCFPDLVWKHGARCSAVIDAKYMGRRADEGEEERADQEPQPTTAEPRLGVGSNALYQMFTYCKLLHLAQGHLVHADVTLPPTQTVRIVDVDITVHRLDLGLPLPNLRIQAGRLADRIAEGRPALVQA